VSKTDLAFWLGIYASAVASVTALWSLFRELWVDRPRILVMPEESWRVHNKGEKWLIVADAALPTVAPGAPKTPILEVTIRNKGRRDATIESVSQLRPDGRSNVFQDFLLQLPITIPAEQKKTIVNGGYGGYVHGQSLKRFYAVDGAGRIHPLRERYRQRLSCVLHLSKPTLPPAEPRELDQP
jgi:hypothetical protein